MAKQKLSKSGKVGPGSAGKGIEKKVVPSIPQRITGPRTLQSVSGFKDRVGAERTWWAYYTQVAFEVLQEKYNFFQVYPASVEYTTAYTRSLGKDHPLVKDNLLTILDPRGEHISLRPSFDISFLRSYYLLHKSDFEDGVPIENWYSIGSVYGDKEDPREKLQLFLSVIGNNHPVVDAECALAAYRFLEKVGFKQIQVMVNSIGGDQSQQNYKQELTAYFKDHRKEVPQEYQKFITKNPFRILACGLEQCQQLLAQAPQSVDWLQDNDKEHFIRVLEYLDELDIPYMLSPELVPLDDYQHKTIIGLKVTTDDGTEYVLARGGRYDGLAKVMTDMDIPAMKIAIDLDRVMTATRTQHLQIPKERIPQVFLAQLADDAKKKALVLREQLHEAGIVTAEHFGKDSLRAQLEQANSLGVKYTCVLGQKEIIDGTILIRDMDGGLQEEVNIDKLIPELKKRLS